MKRLLAKIKDTDLQLLGILSFLIFFLITPLIYKIRVAEGVYVEPLLPLLILGVLLILTSSIKSWDIKGLWLAVREVIFPNLLSVLFFLLIGALFVSFIYGYALTGVFSPGDLLRLIKYSLYFLPFPLAIYAGRHLTSKDIDTVLRIFIAVGAATVLASFMRIYSFVQRGSQIDFWAYNIYSRSVGFLGQFFDLSDLTVGSTGRSAGATYGLYVAVVTGVYLGFVSLVKKLDLKRLLLLMVPVALFLGAVLYTLSRGAAIVMALVIGSWFTGNLLHKKQILASLTALVFLLVIAVFFIKINPQVYQKFFSTLTITSAPITDPSTSEVEETEIVLDSSSMGRIQRWESVFRIYKYEPGFAIFGVGYNSKNLAYFGNIGQTHSFFLDTWVRGSIFALILAGVVWVVIFAYVLRLIFSSDFKIRAFGIPLFGFTLGWFIDNLISGEQFFSDAPMIAFWGILGLVYAFVESRSSKFVRRKVLIALTSSEVGGGPQVVYDFLTEVKNRGGSNFEFIIVAPKGGAFVKKFKALGYRVYAAPLDWIGIRGFIQLFKIAHKEGVDLISSHGKGAGLYARVAGVILGIPVVHTFHGLHYSRKNPVLRSLYLLFEKIMVLMSRFVVSVSPSQEKEGIKLGVFPKSKSRVVVNGIDTGNWKLETGSRRIEIRRGLGLNPKDFAVVMVARFDEVKGHPRFIGLIPELVEKLPNLKLVFVGGGEEEREAMRLSKKLGVWDSVIFLGQRNDVPKILKSVDAFVLPSYHEGLPVSVLEASAAGLPVIGSNVVGIKDAVRDGETGFLINFDKTSRVSKAFAELAKSATLRRKMGEQGRKFVEKEFSMDKFVNSTLKVYEEALSSS